MGDGDLFFTVVFCVSLFVIPDVCALQFFLWASKWHCTCFYCRWGKKDGGISWGKGEWEGAGCWQLGSYLLSFCFLQESEGANLLEKDSFLGALLSWRGTEKMGRRQIPFAFF